MFTSYNKASKKQQKEINKQRRNTWAMSPVTKVVPSKKIYSRKGRKDYAELVHV
jgi:hypothetical protein